MFEVLVFGGIGALVMSLIVRAFMRERSVKRQIDAAPVTSIQRAEHGEGALLVGRITADQELLRGPISGEPCLYYDLTVEIWTASRGRRGGWEIAVRERRAVPFLLRDETGSARVEVCGDDRIEPTDRTEGTTQRGILVDQPPPVVAELVVAAGHELDNGFGQERGLRWLETRLKPGIVVAVCGRVLRAEAQHSAYRAAPEPARVTRPRGGVVVVDRALAYKAVSSAGPGSG